ncbi:unnamed protein product [Alternaria burnsii]|nr:unnamed protein product [Alternaria burnsii]
MLPIHIKGIVSVVFQIHHSSYRNTFALSLSTPPIVSIKFRLSPLSVQTHFRISIRSTWSNSTLSCSPPLASLFPQ